LTQTATVHFVAGAVVAEKSTVTATPAQVAADNAEHATITVHLLDAHGNGVPSKRVALSSSRGEKDTITGGGPSDDTGAVAFTVRSEVLGSSTFAATDSDDGLVLPQTTVVLFS